MTTQVRVRAPGKVNLYLAVGPLQPDGYHPLANLFQAVDLHEDITATASPTLSLTLTGRGEDLPTDHTNLAIRAAHLLADHAGVPARAHLTIHKRIPVAGGMAGGSADAAGTLVALNRLWNLHLDPATLQSLGAQLGADVPFCLMGGTAMGLGRGDVLTPVVSRGTYTWLIVTQHEGLSTPRVFAEFDSRRSTPPARPVIDERFVRALAEGDTAYVAMNARNDLAAPALFLHDGARQVYEAARARLALPTIVSGSGPTIAVLCPDDDTAESLGEYICEHTVAESAFVAHGPVPGAHVVDES
ncbi:MAG: 4-(cytidine 5'-diphospho)-2-C-methyl-D-erythritol kinase [Actinomycetes bacterium]|nr:4-(cytidine 5'-diphospho)-2-C-methyl-D-erythritol kinase [Actinomycetes bacterium]MDX5379897.1 4-(cytidine 5'-diphospho)-2-C-methyl-D-erythritol kinase [Actinomycetes bacterium]MDX5398382.1 4-(cytidine 5'-diphospho)-2-C-methyl-D-erythritol kinase [Actinomycetes bacterium]MDX5449606.1 4-(cytidine 5'-diphospho)-2-C-methyl-D-erythritol kinase [Actinomycetes bacterium]